MSGGFRRQLGLLLHFCQVEHSVLPDWHGSPSFSSVLFWPINVNTQQLDLCLWLQRAGHGDWRGLLAASISRCNRNCPCRKKCLHCHLSMLGIDLANSVSSLSLPAHLLPPHPGPSLTKCWMTDMAIWGRNIPTLKGNGAASQYPFHRLVSMFCRAFLCAKMTILTPTSSSL